MARLIKYEHRGQLISIDKQSIDGLEEAIRWAEREVPQQARRALNRLVQTMALVNQSYARTMSFGPHDPYRQRDSDAWRTPSQGIRRISENYYFGWKVRGIAPGVWQLYNDSREAYFIEFGIHTSNRRIRRPVRKLSQLRTLRYMMTTKAYHRVWMDIYLSPRRGKNRGRGGFTQHVQSPAGGHTRWVQISEHQAGSARRRVAGKVNRSPNIQRDKNGNLVIRAYNAGGGKYTGRLRGRRLR